MVYIQDMETTATTARTASLELLSGQTTQALLLALLAIDTKAVKTAEERMSAAWICEAIEVRYDVEAAMDAWADEDDHGMTYAEALLAALPMEAVA